MTPEVLLTRLAQSLRVFVAGLKDDPGTSDLDDEQHIWIGATLGDWRKARYLVWYIDNTLPDPLKRERVVPIIRDPVATMIHGDPVPTEQESAIEEARRTR